MKEMADLKAKLKDQNARLLQVAQERAKMEAKNKTRQAQVKLKFEKPNPILSYSISWQGSRNIPSTRKALRLIAYYEFYYHQILNFFIF